MPEIKKPTLSERKRVDIIDSAVLEFQETGFAGARMDKISARASVSKRTLYKHFASKELLFQAIVEIVLSGHQNLKFAPYRPDAPIKDQLLVAVTLYVSVISDDTNIGLTRVVLSEFMRDPAASKSAFERSELNNKGFVALIGEAMQDGKLRKTDPAYAMAQLSSLIKAFLFWPQFLLGEPLPDKKATANIIDDSVSMFLSHYQV